jgi:1,4-alpha-glucan branching enzyme
MWLNEKTDWMYPHLSVAQERMSELAHRLAASSEKSSSADPGCRAIRQAGRELLLAQASDWPFIIRTGTSPDYARNQLKTHLARFNRLYEQVTTGTVDPDWLESVESADNLFPDIEVGYWA